MYECASIHPSVPPCVFVTPVCMLPCPRTFTFLQLPASTTVWKKKIARNLFFYEHAQVETINIIKTKERQVTDRCNLLNNSNNNCPKQLSSITPCPHLRGSEYPSKEPLCRCYRVARAHFATACTDSTSPSKCVPPKSSKLLQTRPSYQTLDDEQDVA